jgi:hypothetical protein
MHAAGAGYLGGVEADLLHPLQPVRALQPQRLTGDGFFPSERWRTGEYIRDRFTITIPSNWQGNRLAIDLAASDPHGVKAAATGAAPANDPNLLVLGVLPLGSQPLPTP